MAELKKLIPGDTCMGVLANGVLKSNKKIISSPHEYLLFYGNLVVMPDTKKHYFAPPDVYMDYLNAFLDSKEGQKYERPTPEQIEEDILTVLNSDYDDSANEPGSDAFDKQPINNSAKNTEDNPLIQTEESTESTDAEIKTAEHDTQDDENSASDEANETSPVETAKKESVEEKVEVAKKEKKSLFGEKKSKAPARPETEEIEVDTSWLDEIEENPDAYVSPKGRSSIDSKAQDTRIGKLSRQVKHLRTVALLLLVCAMLPWLLMGLGMMNFGPMQKTAADEIQVISLANDIKAGNAITAGDLQLSTIMRSQFNDMSSGTTVDSAGNAVPDYIQLWSNRNSIIGKYAADNLSAGDYLMASDYATLKNGLNMIEIDIDGTKVKVPIKATATGTSDMRLYAIVTSRSAEGITNSFALNLGELTFEGKSLKDILNSDGNLILEEIIQN